jgi:phosphoglycolate phosphatase
VAWDAGSCDDGGMRMAPGARTLLLWDVDHTLIENGGVSKENYGRAFALLVGHLPRLPPHTDGRTDRAIMGDLLTVNGVLEEFSWPDQLAALTEAGADHRSRLANRGHALPGAAECLDRLSSDPVVIQSVLTGNVEPNARVKLEVFGLDRAMDFRVGAYGDDHLVRGELVPVAQGRASQRYDFDPVRDVTVLVGDTTRDVEAGLIGGARVIGVSTGPCGPEELSGAGADVALVSLADINMFEDALERTRALGPRRRRIM